MRKASKVYSQFENENHIYQLEKINDYFFQEVYFTVSDIIGDYYEVFDTFGEARKDFMRVIKEG